MYEIDLNEELGQNFIDYAIAVNTDRAIPSVEDGLKPVARRILYDMADTKLFHNKTYVKCGRVVGSVMGHWHPHGDAAVYDALTRLSQPWSMRYPLVDWHGNQGNIVGDSAAASRYTECRLEKLSEDGLLAYMNKNIVEMQPNYDETQEEPKLLPALFPNLLCNPTQGIGVALACNWLPHNLRDIAEKAILPVLRDEEIDYDNLFPDFPLGGIIVNQKDVATIYKTGRGKVIVESEYHEETRGNKRLLVFTSLPFQVFIQPLLEKIAKEYAEGNLPHILDVQDESGLLKPRIVFEIEKDVDIDQVAEILFNLTDLRKSFSANQVALVGKAPTLLTLAQVVDHYIAFNLRLIVNRYKYDFDTANIRVEILKGLSKALTDIDNIVALIKNSDTAANAQSKLIEKYGFSDRQVKAILDMKLSRLANLEKVKVENELQEKEEYAQYCQAIIKSEAKQKEILINELQQLVKEFADDRRTKVIQKEIKRISKSKEAKIAVPQDVVIQFTDTGYIRCIPMNQYRNSAAKATFKCQTNDIILLFSNLGKQYRIFASDVKECGPRDKGQACGALVKLTNGEKIVNIFSMNIDEKYPYIVFFTKNGLVKKTDKTEFITDTRNLNGLKATGINDNDEIIAIEETNGDYAEVRTKDGMGLCFRMEEVRATGKGAKGVKSISLKDGDYVCEVKIIKDKNQLSLSVGKRAQKGKKL